MKYYPLTTNTLSKNDTKLAIEVLKSGNITRGKYNRFVERYFSLKFKRYALLVNSGSSANLLAFALLINQQGRYKFKKNDEIIIPSLCWSTSLYPIIQMGLKPVFVDVDKNTLNLDLDDLEAKITNKTKGIMAVHALGNCTEMSQLNKIVKKYKLILIEDTCEALGSKYKNKYLGTFGSLSSFSFYFSHHITSGEGGMILCKSINDYKILLSLRSHGWSREIDVVENKKKTDFKRLFNFVNLGYNLRMTDIQASLLYFQSKKIDNYRINRLYNFRLIYKVLSQDDFIKKNVSLIPNRKNGEISWFNFPIILKNLRNKNRDLICEKLNKKGIETRPIISGDFSSQKIIKNNYNYLSKFKLQNSKIINDSGFMIGISSIKLDKKIIIKLSQDLKTVISSVKKRNS